MSKRELIYEREIVLDYVDYTVHTSLTIINMYIE